MNNEDERSMGRLFFKRGHPKRFFGERFNLLKSKIGVPCSEIKMNNEHPLTICE
jgi:hypothetical protein